MHIKINAHQNNFSKPRLEVMSITGIYTAHHSANPQQ